MQSGTWYEELGITTRRPSASPLSHSFQSHTADNDIQTTETRRTATTASTSCASHVSGLSGSSCTDAGDTRTSWDDAGFLFQEKIRLLRNSMREQKGVHQEQQRRVAGEEEEKKDLLSEKADKSYHAPMVRDGRVYADNNSNDGGGGKESLNDKMCAITSSLFMAIPPPTWCRIALSERDNAGENIAVAEVANRNEVNKTPTKTRGTRSNGGGDNTDCGDFDGAASAELRSVTKSPEVMVVVSPLRPTGYCRDASTMKEYSSPAESYGDKSRSSCQKDSAHEGTETIAQSSEMSKGKKTFLDAKSGQGKQNVCTAATSTRIENVLVSPPSQCGRKGEKGVAMMLGSKYTSTAAAVTKDVETEGSGSAVHTVGGIKPNRLRNFASQESLARGRSPALKKTAEIRTLRAPSEISSSSSRLSSQPKRRQQREQQVCATSSVSLLPRSDTETKWTSNSEEDDDDDDTCEPAPRRPSKSKAVQLQKQRLEQLVRHGVAHVVVVDSRSVSSENPGEPTIRILHGRSSSRRSSSRVDTLRGPSLSVAQMCVTNDPEPSVPQAQPHSSCHLPGRGRTGTDTGDSASGRQRRSLLRQIKLIDAEIRRMEEVPWTMSLRSGSGLATKLNAEKAKLVMLRRRYESELKKTARHETVKVTPSPSVPNPQASCMPRSRPSVYEAILQMQREREQESARLEDRGKKVVLSKQCTININPRKGMRKCAVDDGSGVDDLPPRAQPPATISFRPQDPFRSTSLVSSHARDYNYSVRRTCKNGISGRGRPLSLDAERMAMLYLQKASSSSTAASSSSSMRRENSRVEEDGVPVYWRIAHGKREPTEAQGEVSREMGSTCQSSCEPFSSSAQFASQQPPSVAARGAVEKLDYSWCEEGLCSDVSADQYYCVGYGEEDVDEDLRGIARRRATASQRGGSEQVLKWTVHSKKQKQQREGKGQQRLLQAPCSRSRSRSSVRLAGPASSATRTRKDHSTLCFRLRAPPLQEIPRRCDSNHLCFRSDLKPYEIKCKSPSLAQPQFHPRKDVGQCSTSMEGREVEGRERSRTLNAPTLSHPFSKGQQPQRSDISNVVAQRTDAQNSKEGSARPVQFSFAESEHEKGSLAIQCHQFNSYAAGEDSVAWTSPPRPCTSPPAVTTTPPPPIFHSQRRLDCQEDKNVGYQQQQQQNLRRGQDQHVIEDKFPSFFHHCYHSPKEISSQFSEVRVSPLTECSTSGESPAGSSQRRTATHYSNSRDSMERGPDFREVMMNRWHRRSVSAEHSPPAFSTAGNKRKTPERPNTGGLTCSSADSPSLLKSKSYRHLGDDLTNEPRVGTYFTPHMTRRIGAGGVTLRQLFGHDSKLSRVSKVSSQEVRGKVSTDILLDRINRMRAQMD